MWPTVHSLPVPKAGACMDGGPIWNPMANPCPCASPCAGAGPPNMKGAGVRPCDDDCKGEGEERGVATVRVSIVLRGCQRMLHCTYL